MAYSSFNHALARHRRLMLLRTLITAALVITLLIGVRTGDSIRTPFCRSACHRHEGSPCSVRLWHHDTLAFSGGPRVAAGASRRVRDRHRSCLAMKVKARASARKAISSAAQQKAKYIQIEDVSIDAWRSGCRHLAMMLHLGSSALRSGRRALQ